MALELLTSLLARFFDPFSLYNYCSPDKGEHFFAGVAQLVEQLIRNQQVSGSSPLAGFKFCNLQSPEFLGISPDCRGRSSTFTMI